LKIVVDMNLSVEWVGYLEGRGFSCQHWNSIGLGTDGDEAIIAHCVTENAIVLTADLDFADLHALRGTGKPSVIQLRASDQLPSALGHSVARALTVARRELEQGAIVTITPTKVRISKLPIGSSDLS
jgi:predicted nuclease of predicted toxin-antitoxin system